MSRDVQVSSRGEINHRITMNTHGIADKCHSQDSGCAHQTVENVINICVYNNIENLMDVSHCNKSNDNHNGTLNYNKF